MKIPRAIGAGLLACLLPVVLLAVPAHAGQTADMDTAAWCRAQAKNSPTSEARCVAAEQACHAALPDMAPAGGCPDRRLDRCMARLSGANSWCAVLCCLDPEQEACRNALPVMPGINSLLVPEDARQQRF